MKGSLLVFGSRFDLLKLINDLGYKSIFINYESHEFADVYIPLATEDARIDNFNIGKLKKYFSRQIKGIIVSNEYYVTLAAKIHNSFLPELVGISVEQARILRNKLLLKKKLLEFKIPTTIFTPIGVRKSFENYKSLLGTPYLVKPKSEVLAKGINLITDEKDWADWKLGHVNELDDYYLEEYVKVQKEYCCDTLVYDGEVILQFPGEYTVSCYESNQKHEGFGVNFPGFLPNDKIEEIKQYTKDFIKKIGIKNGFFHAEYLYDGSSWKFGEVGCRLAGGLQIPTESLICGANILELYIKMFTQGEKPSLDFLSQDGRYFGYYLYPKKVGKVKSIFSDFDKSYILEKKIHVRIGDVLQFEDSSITSSAHIIYQANSIDELQNISNEVKSLFHIEYENS